ncbi:hypothetical protein PR202_gb19836 [Eleusine coracana subsp. coracana]|uniref:BTB domain-containing protein n=1 Tax=Eleusine coracana subsp. coracana TaxID=191504 RepID=A0AAV5F973_ELECO|nr:hypothetical protein PR202_gb19836 [Eleusine coracana subsp. coracana]
MSNEGTDVKFQIGDETFAAHRCVLAARSAVFKAELFGPMKEGTTSVIGVDDIEPQVFKLLLSFIYSDSVMGIEEEDEHILWQHLLVAADRYDLQRLRIMSEKKLCRSIQSNTVVPILALAEQHRFGGLKDACLDFLNSPANLQVLMANGGLDELTSSCPAVLKELIAKLASLKFDDANSDTGVDAVPLVAASVPPSDIHQDFARLLQSGEGTDMTFQVGNETLKAHRCVLAARSSVFRNQLFSSAEGMAPSSVIRIDNMEPKVIELLLSFIYSDQMPEIKDTEGEEVTQQDDDMDVIWQHLLAAAGVYELQRLKLLCEDKLCGYINVSTVATILALAEQHHCQRLKETCLDFLESPANLHDVMATGGLEHLRNSCSSVLIDLIAKLAYVPKA